MSCLHMNKHERAVVEEKIISEYYIFFIKFNIIWHHKTYNIVLCTTLLIPPLVEERKRTA